jgi:hypothetical protein
MAWTAEHERRGAWPGNPWGLGCDYRIIYHDIYIYNDIYYDGFIMGMIYYVL